MQIELTTRKCKNFITLFNMKKPFINFLPASQTPAPYQETRRDRVLQQQQRELGGAYASFLL
jgi:hypothetical protein